MGMFWYKYPKNKLPSYKKNVEEIKVKIKTIMKNIKYEKNGELQQNSKNGAINLYNSLQLYYKYNPSTWSNFCSLWKKVHNLNNQEVGKVMDKNSKIKVADTAIVYANADYKYKSVKKGILPYLKVKGMENAFFIRLAYPMINKKGLFGSLLDKARRIIPGRKKIKDDQIPDGEELLPTSEEED